MLSYSPQSSTRHSAGSSSGHHSNGVAEDLMPVTGFGANLLLTAEVTKQPYAEINSEVMNFHPSSKVKMCFGKDYP